jgi:arylformamidase
MKIHDISRAIVPSAAVYPGDDALAVEEVCSIGPDAPCNITALGNWTTHFLTHVDPPRHFVAGGATLDDIPLDRFVGRAIVVEVAGDVVGPEDVPTEIRGASVLFKTRNSDLDPSVFDENHVYLSAAAVDRLVAGGANLVGIDYLSVDRYGDEDYPAHRGLLGAEVLILEGTSLASVSAGEYELIALPLKIAEGDGSPVRAVLIDR